MELFYAKIEPMMDDRGCWEWAGARCKPGYGRFAINRRPRLAHRVSYELHLGSIPEGMHVCHKCDNPSCVNPDHLFLGTDADNLRDMRNKGRGFTPFQPGSKSIQAKLNEEQVRYIRFSAKRNCELAKELGVARNTISTIRSGITWKGTL